MCARMIGVPHCVPHCVSRSLCLTHCVSLLCVTHCVSLCASLCLTTVCLSLCVSLCLTTVPHYGASLRCLTVCLTHRHSLLCVSLCASLLGVSLRCLTTVCLTLFLTAVCLTRLKLRLPIATVSPRTNLSAGGVRCRCAQPRSHAASLSQTANRIAAVLPRHSVTAASAVIGCWCVFQCKVRKVWCADYGARVRVHRRWFFSRCGWGVSGV